MLPNAFMESMKKGALQPVYLFLGAESYRRRVCREALIKRALGESERESGLTRHDLDQMPLQEVIDDARSLSLFSPARVIWVSGAEAVLPRGRSKSSDSPALAALGDYVASPSPSTVLVVESSRWEFEGEGKKKLERVQSFYSVIPAAQVVVFPPYNPADARRLAGQLAQRGGVKVGPAELGLLSEAVGHDATRIAAEIEKLRLYVGEGNEVTASDIAKMVPSARAATTFELVNALGRGDRESALSLLDTLVREGEYLPLSLSFIEAQFRQALVVKEMGFRTPKQISSYFEQSGIRLFFSRAQEIQGIAQTFSAAELKKAVVAIYQADKGLRDARPDDRTIMERFVLGLRRG